MKCKDLFRIAKFLTLIAALFSVIIIPIATFQKVKGIEPPKTLMYLGTILIPLTGILFLIMLGILIFSAYQEHKNDKRNSRS